MVIPPVDLKLSKFIGKVYYAWEKMSRGKIKENKGYF
jgi:hypothetical protein